MIKKALVTGSSGGIGRAIVLELAGQGFDVAVHYNQSKTAAEVTRKEAATFDVSAVSLPADITDGAQAKDLVDRAAEALDGLSVVVNNVGDFLEKPLGEMSNEDWHRMLDSNLNSTFYVTQAAVPHLITAGAGRVVNFACASAQNVLARRGNAAYMVAKTGVVLYTKSLAAELAANHITVNAVLPGIAENSFDVEEMIPRLPLGRPATLAEISHAVQFFVDPMAGYVTGQVLEVSGGWNL